MNAAQLEAWRNSPESLGQRLATCEKALADSLDLNLRLIEREAAYMRFERDIVIASQQTRHNDAMLNAIDSLRDNLSPNGKQPHDHVPSERNGDDALHGQATAS